MSKATANFVHALAAVLAGNGAYYLLMRYLPVRTGTRRFRWIWDWWWISGFAWWRSGIIKTAASCVGEAENSPGL